MKVPAKINNYVTAKKEPKKVIPKLKVQDKRGYESEVVKTRV